MPKVSKHNHITEDSVTEEYVTDWVTMYKYGRDKSVTALGDNIIKYYKTKVMDGVKHVRYCFKWSRQGHYMSPSSLHSDYDTDSYSAKNILKFMKRVNKYLQRNGLFLQDYKVYILANQFKFDTTISFISSQNE